MGSKGAKFQAISNGGGRLRHLLTRSSILAVVGVVGVSGVAAAAVGAPVPVIGDVLPGGDDPELVSLVGPEKGGDEGDEGAQGADDGQDDGQGTDDEDEAIDVSAAAKSDCFKPGNGDDVGDDGTSDDGAADGESGQDEPFDCGEVMFKNHGQFVASLAHERNLQKMGERCADAEAESEKALRCEARLAAKADRWANKSGDDDGVADTEADSDGSNDKAERRRAKADQKAEKRAAKAAAKEGRGRGSN